MPPAAASRSARPPSTSRGTGTPLPLPLSATGGDAIVETSTGASGRFVASLLEFGPLPVEVSDAGTPLPTWFGTLLLP